MAEKINIDINFEEILSENINYLFSARTDFNNNIQPIISLMNNLGSIPTRQPVTIDKLNISTNQLNIKIEELKTTFSNILSTIKKNSNIATSFFSNEKSKVFKLFEEFKNTNILIMHDSSIILDNLRNLINEKKIDNISYLALEEKIQELIKKIDLQINTSINCISENQLLFRNLLNIQEQFQSETTATFSKRFNKEKDIILNEFNKKLEQITQEFEFKQKELQADFNEIKIKYTKLDKEFNFILEKNNKLNQKLIDYDQNINKLIFSENDKIQSELNSVSINLIEGFEKKFKDMDAEFDNAKQAKNNFIQLVEKAGIYNLTENYNKKSKEEKNEYQKFRGYTSFALFAAIGVTVIILCIPIIEFWGINPPVDTNYYTILARLTISLMFFVLALYFSKQAAKHYECYQENHKTFLQLAALEPFMAKMDPSDQLAIRKQLIPIYFNQDGERRFASNGDEVGLPESLKPVVEKLTDALKDIKSNQSSKPQS